MASFTDVTATDPESGVFTQNAAVIPGNTGQFFTFAWIATARPAITDISSAATGSKIDVKTRTSQEIFARGLRENIRISTNDGLGWRWRRICFNLKGDYITGGNIDPTTSDYFRLTSSGMSRLITEIPDNRIHQLVFRGQRNEDWIDVFSAQTDKRKCGILYDKTRIIQSNNGDGATKHYKLWHPIGKNIMYDDEEQGTTYWTSPLSAEGRRGWGDFYVVDFIECNYAGTGTPQMSFLPNATLYWHEK